MTTKQHRIEKTKKLAALGLTKQEIAAYFVKKPTEEQAYKQGRAIGLENAMTMLRGRAGEGSAAALICFVLLLRLVALLDFFNTPATHEKSN